MKRIICFLLAVIMLVSLVACGDTNQPGGVQDESTEAQTTAPVIAEKIDAEPFDGVFKAGYARVDITPTMLPIAKKDNGGSYKKVQDKLYATCIAVNDGKTTALLITVDVTSIGVSQCENFKKYITNATKVPAENIIISATHTHTTPVPGIPGSGTANIRWLTDCNNAMATVAKEAIADLAETTVHVGTTEVKGMAFVRRGYSADGNPYGIWRKNTGDMVRYESEADNSVQVIRFIREDKKDIVMANLQTHFTEAGNYITDTISADLGGVLRSIVEINDEDALFGVYVGASGNINTVAYVSGTKVFGNYNKMGKAVAEAILATELTEVEAGYIKTTMKDVKTNVRKEDAETIEKATKAEAEIKALNKYDGDDEVVAIAYKYGFESAKDVHNVFSRNTNYGATRIHTIMGISFGDLAFVAAPYEMFDTNGMEIKNGSPFNMTFVITNAGGAGAYVPSALAVPNGGYEVYTAVDEFGTAERMVSEFLTILRSHKGIK